MNIFTRFLSWFISIFRKPKKEEPKVYKDINCYYCSKKLYLTKDFLCPYCKKYHCEKHRLPKEHNCKGKVRKPKDLNENIPVPKKRRS